MIKFVLSSVLVLVLTSKSCEAKPYAMDTYNFHHGTPSNFNSQASSNFDQRSHSNFDQRSPSNFDQRSPSNFNQGQRSPSNFNQGHNSFPSNPQNPNQNNGGGHSISINPLGSVGRIQNYDQTFSGIQGGVTFNK